MTTENRTTDDLRPGTSAVPYYHKKAYDLTTGLNNRCLGKISRESYKMANVRVHEIIDAFYGANVIDDEEFLLLHKINRPRNPRFPY